MTLRAGETLGPYEILAPLGAGGMGEVYRARDPRLDREVAIKVLPGDVARDPERRARFDREARAAGSLNHPNLLVVHDVGWEDDTPYLVTELLRGESLLERLRHGALAPAAALDVATQLAAALAAAHRQGVVHRDLKPANVFLAEGERVKVLDFGLAKLLATSSDVLSEAETQAGTTSPGMLIGTLDYMAPEQVRGQSADSRADVFAFGELVYEMLTAERPFARPTPSETISAILRDDPPPLAERAPAAPAGLAGIVERCLAKSAARRPASGAELVAALQTLRSPSRRKTRARRKAIESIAVLPFAVEAEHDAVEYLADGISEGLILALSRLPRLRVMARSTVFRFKGSAADPRTLGAELGVAVVLTGRLSRRGDLLQAQAELVDVGDGAVLWSERFRSRLEDLVATEEELVRGIATELRPKLDPETGRRLRRAATLSGPAYEAYLQGRFLWNRWTPDGLRAAIAHYERAIALDPRFAAAHAGLADAWAVLGNIKAVAPDEAYPRAKAAALAALAIDGELAAAHASLGYVRRFFDWDWPAAEESFRRAVRLDPGYATGRRWYGQFLSGMGRHEEALAEVRRALELEPLSLIIHTAVGDVLFYARRSAEAIPYYRRAIELDPAFLAGHSDLARALEHCGRLAEAVEEYRTALRLAGDSTPDPSVGLANVLAVSGQRAEALGILEELKSRRERQYISPWGVASVYAVLGERAEALAWLERAYAEHDSTLVWLKVHPRFDPLRGEPKLQELLHRLGLGGGTPPVATKPALA